MLRLWCMTLTVLAVITATIIGVAPHEASAKTTSSGISVVNYPLLPISPPPPPAPVTPPPPTSYTVVSGDTLSALAATLGRTVDQLGRFNNMADPNILLVGQVLQIPPVSYAAAPYPVVAPPPLVRSVAAVSEPSGGYSAPVAASSSFEACVISRESGGNSQVMNSSGHYGLYQFSYSTWVANGGSPSAFGDASPAQQHAVFINSSPSNWSAYDGC
jgi:LysM repeat protein